MKTKHDSFFFGITLFFVCLTATAQAGTLLEWERSADLQTWLKVPSQEIQYSADGALIVPDQQPQAFYRLLIRPNASGETGDFLRLADVPISFHRRAAQLLLEMRDGEQAPGWRNGKLRDFVRPLYRPDVQGVAYYEFSVVSLLPNSKLDAPGNEKSAGFIILSTGPHDFPIAHWSDDAEPPSVELTRRAAADGKRPVRFYKLDALAYAGEDADGEITGNLGTALHKITGAKREWLDLEKQPINTAVSIPERETISDAGVTEIKHSVEATGPQPPAIEFGDFGSWKNLKAGFAESFGVHTEALRRIAVLDWATDEAAQKMGEGLVDGQVYLIPLLFDNATFKVEGDIANYATVELMETKDTGLPPYLRIIVNEVPADGTKPFVIQITNPGHEPENLPFVLVTVPKPQNHALGHWSSWTTYMAGTDSDQRLYRQFDMSPGCPSGCGPTAWAMLFGWGDRQAAIGNAYWAPRTGLYLFNGGYGADAVAPPGMEPGIYTITREIRGYVGTFCIAGSGATFPWDMPNGWRYFINRTGTALRADWNSFGIHSDDLRNAAVAEIRDRRTPAVIGTGWLSHYPLAYGYMFRFRTVQACGICFWTNTDWERCFKVNQGWGGTGNGWVSAGTWFAGRICPNGPCR